MASPIVDAHLDLAYNVLHGRDLDLEAAAVRRAEQRSSGSCMVTLPELRRGGVAIVFGTLYAAPSGFGADDLPVYAEPAGDQARRQLQVYLDWERTGRVRLLRTRGELDGHLEEWEHDRVPGLLVLMEGADPIAEPGELGEWWDAGVRAVGLAWSRTRYAGGTHRPAGLSPAGRELVERMAGRGALLDLSHLAEEAFWDALQVGHPAVLASHSNARALVSGDRQLSDSMIEAIAAAGGVIGLNLYARFTVEGWEPGAAFTAADLGRHARHIADLAGWEGVGIGSDLDGGLGVEETPAELQSAADLGLLEALAPAEHRDGFRGGNWIRLLRRALPV